MLHAKTDHHFRVGQGGENITFATVAPDPVSTNTMPPILQVKPIKELLVAATRAEDRIGTVDDLIDAVLLLVKSRWITDLIISVSGGITAPGVALIRGVAENQPNINEPRFYELFPYFYL